MFILLIFSLSLIVVHMGLIKALKAQEDGAFVVKITRGGCSGIFGSINNTSHSHLILIVCSKVIARVR